MSKEAGEPTSHRSILEGFWASSTSPRSPLRRTAAHWPPTSCTVLMQGLSSPQSTVHTTTFFPMS
jgi:hypothetical protein